MPRFQASAAGCSTRCIRDNTEPLAFPSQMILNRQMACTDWHRAKEELPGQLPPASSPITDHVPPTRRDDSFMLRNPSHHHPSTSSSISSFLTSPFSLCTSLQLSNQKGIKKKGLRHKSLLIDLKLCFETKPSGLESLYFNEKKGWWKSGNTPRNKQPRLRAYISSSLCP